MTRGRGILNVSFRPNNFDLMRLLAAMQVVIVHSASRLGVTGTWVQVAYWFSGVPIFFAISGYLVSASFEGQQNCLQFLRNRLLRIYPGLWVCVACTAIAVLALGYRGSRIADIAWFPAQLVGLIYTPPFLKSFGMGSYNGSLWTIPLELQFYLLVPLLYVGRLTERSRTVRIICCFLLFLLIAIALRLWMPDFGTGAGGESEKLLSYVFVSRFHQFLFGVALQRLHAYRSRWITGKAAWWLAIYLALRLLFPQPKAALHLFFDLVLGALCISAAYTLPHLADRLLRGQDISYGVYMYHGLLINLVLEASLGVRQTVGGIAIVFAGAVLLGTLSWTIVERPCLRKKRKSGARMSEPQALSG